MFLRRPVEAGGSVAVVFVGCVVPEGPRYHTAAFSQAGQMYQRELLSGLARAGLAPSVVLSALPLPGYPKSRRLWVRGEEAGLPDGTPLKLLPFINVTPLKQVTIGLATLVRLLLWGYRTRGSGSRLVYTYNLSVPPGLFTLLGARIVGAKAVVSLCDVNVPGATVPDKWAWRLDYWLHRRLAPRFDAHVVASDAIARDFAAGKPCLRVEGGIRKEQLAAEAAASPGGDGEKETFVVTATGRLDDINGIPVLLRAFSLLEGSQYRLRIAGAGPLEGLVRQAAAADPRIAFYGLISFTEVLGLYRDSDVLVNMRITKGMSTNYFFPSKMMEYLASGTPVVTTCTGHVEEEFGALVYLLRDETPEGLADAIRLAARQGSTERRNLGRKAREYMLAHKTWSAQALKLARFLRGAVLGNGTEALRCPREPQDGPSIVEAAPRSG